MNIQSICNSITKAIDTARAPLLKLPPILMYYTCLKRPGLSAMMIASRIIQRQSEAGAPFGAAADGSANIAEAMERVRAEEYVKALKMESIAESTAPIGSIQFIGTGANAGGPVVINGFNVNFPTIKGIIR
jgi:hypothetical protein